MPIFRVRGVNRWGRSFAVRFEAPSEHDLRAFLETERVQVEGIRRTPLSVWPFSRLPWMILVFPVLAWGLVWSVTTGWWTALDFGREESNRAVYERLMEEGESVPGVVSGERRVSLRGARRRQLEYTFRTPDGTQHRGRLVSLPGDVAAGRHDLRLLGGRPLQPGSPLTVTYLPEEPRVNAPFRVDAALLARQQESVRGERRRLGELLLAAPLLAWMVFNLVLRTGSHYEHGERPRIVQIVPGESVLVPPSEEEGEEGQDEEV
jgi:hypothetical protein